MLHHVYKVKRYWEHMEQNRNCLSCLITWDGPTYLAFSMTGRQIQVVTQDDQCTTLSYDVSSDDEWILGILTVYLISQLSGFSKQYTIIHLKFQEFLSGFTWLH